MRTRRTPTVWVASIREPYASDTVAGVKRIELRRRGCSFKRGDRVLVYASRPRGEVIGEVTVDSVDRWPVDDLMCAEWYGLHRVDRQDVRAYAGGGTRRVDHLTCIWWDIQGCTAWGEALSLDALRDVHSVQPGSMWVRAPQSLIHVADAHRGTSL